MGGPHSQGLRVRSASQGFSAPGWGFLFGVIAVRMSTLRSGLQLVFGLFGFVGDFLVCFWFLFVFHLWFLWGSWFLL